MFRNPTDSRQNCPHKRVFAKVLFRHANRTHYLAVRGWEHGQCTDCRQPVLPGTRVSFLLCWYTCRSSLARTSKGGAWKKTSSAWRIAVAVLAVIAAAFTAYNLGWSNAQAEHQAKAELSTLLNRSDMETIELVDGPVYVFGHQSPDSDTVCSAIAYAELLRDLGYDAQPAVLGPVNAETGYILEKAEVEAPEVLEDASGLNVVLVDHDEYAQSAEGLKDANIISIIDHHGEGNITTSNQLVYDARPLGSTATIVLIRYYNYGFEPSPQTAKLMLGALLSDTSNLQSSTTTYPNRSCCRRVMRLPTC